MAKYERCQQSREMDLREHIQHTQRQLRQTPTVTDGQTDRWTDGQTEDSSGRAEEKEMLGLAG